MNKTMSRVLLGAVVCAMVLPLGGCFKWRTRIADFTVLSTKNTHIPYKEIGRSSHETCVKIWPFYVDDEGMNWEDPIDALLIEKGGNMMVDGVLSYEYRNYIIGSNNCVTVEGTAVNTVDKKVAQKAAPAAKEAAPAGKAGK